MIGDRQIMKNAKKIGIAIVQVVIAGILVFIAIKHSGIDKQKDTDIGQVTVEQVVETPEPAETATPESATSDLETNADGYGEETLTQTEDGSYLDGEASDDENSLTDEETSEQPEATATPAPVATATPQPVQATPQPTAAPQPAATAVPQPAAPQPEQQYDASGVVPDWVDENQTAADDYDPNFDWGDTVLQ